MASLETTDYLLVNRSDSTYKITGADFINSVIDPLEITVVIAPNPPLIRENAEAIPVVTGGKQPDGGYVFTYQWHYADDLLGTNKVDIPGQTASTYVVPESDITKFIGCTVTTTDALNTTASGTGYGGPVSAVEIAPVIDEVILTEIYDGENRFTDKEFPYTTVMGLDGTPDPTFAVKARLSGTTFNFGVESDTITKVEGAGENVYSTDRIASVSTFISSGVDWTAGDGSQSFTDVDITDWLTANNITSVSGFRMELYSGSRGSEIRSFNIDGTDLKGSNLTATNQTGAWYSTATPNNWLDGSGAAVQNNNGESSFRFAAQAITGTVTVTITATNGYIYLIDDNDQEYPLMNSGTQLETLTFPTANNFDKFEVGDVVQSDWNQSQEWSDGGDNNIGNPWEYTFDGDLSTKVSSGVGTRTVCTLNVTGTVFEIYGNENIWNESISIQANGVNVRSDEVWTDISSIVNGNLTSVSCLDGGSSQYTQISAIRVDGKLLVDQSVSNPDAASITAIDEAGPTITVDGGSWKGADGSGDQGDGRYEPSQQWSALLTGAQQAVKAFDGNLTTHASAGTVADIFSFTTSFENVSSMRVKFRSDGDIPQNPISISGNGFDTLEAQGTLGNSQSDKWQTITVTSSNVSGITIAGSSTTGATLCALEINNTILVDSSIPGGLGATDITKTEAYNTKLTVASDKDLNIITGGIYMTDGTPKQDGSGELEPASYTPQTSEIASVTEITSVTYRYVVAVANDCRTLNWSNAVDQQTVNIGVSPPSGANVYQTMWKLDSPATTTYLNTGSTTASFNLFKSETGQGDWVYDSSGVSSSTIGAINSSSTATYWLAIRVGGGTGETDVFPDRVKADQVMSRNGYYVTADGNITLTFNNPNPDLQYFEVGDLVQGQGTPTLTATTENNVDEWVTNWNDTNGWTSSTNNMTMTWNISGPANIVFKGVRKSSDNPTMTLSVDGVQVDSVAWGTAMNEVSAILPAGNNVVTLKGSRTFRLYSDQSTIDGQFFKINQQVSITAMDTAANTMTVDGGSWYGQDGSGDSGDGRYEPSQEWSQGVSGCTAGTAEGIFNGVTTDGGGVLSNPINTPMTIDFDGLPAGEVIVTLIGDGNATWSLQTNTEPAETFAGQSTTVITKNLGNITLSKLTFQSISQTGAIGGGQIYSISVGGKLLVDSSIPGGGGETNVTGSTETAEGTILQVEGTEVDLSASSGRWIANNKAGIPFSFVPSTPIVDTQNEAYGKLQIINDKAQVTGIQATDPGFLNVTAKNYSIQFPSVFATGNAPDVDLPAGCAISAIVKAENGAGASVKESNVLLPQTPNPEGSAGPITDVEGGGTNVYTTDTIASVDVTNAWDQSEVWSSLISSPQGFQSAKELAFNGNLTNNCQTGAGNPAYITFNKTFTNVTKLEVLGRVVSPNPGTLVISGNGITTTNSPTNGMNKVEVPLTSSTISNLRFQINEVQQGVGITGIWINGILLVDTGITGDPGAGELLTFPTDNNFDKFEVGDVVNGGEKINTIEVTNYSSVQKIMLDGKPLLTDYSSLVTASDGVTPINAGPAGLYVASNMFNGDTSNYCQNQDKTGILINLSSVNVNAETIQVFGSNGGGSTAELKVNGRVLTTKTTVSDRYELETYALDTVKITAIDASVPSITVDGGEWVGTDNSGTVGGATDITKTETYGSKLTVGTNANLDTFIADDALVMVDATGAVASYTPQTSEIASVGSAVEKYWVQASNYNNNFVPDDLNSVSPAWTDGPSPNPIGTGRQYYDLGSVNAIAITTDANQAIAVSNDGSNWTTLTTAAGFGTTKVIGRYVFLAGSSSAYGLTIALTQLTFNTPNPDLQFFRPGDNVGTSSGFTPVLYTGNGGTQSITGVGFSPDLVWIKSRTGYSHKLFDTVRGPQKYIESDLTVAETTSTIALSSFDSDGFTVGSLPDINYSGDGFVAWCWDAGDTTVTNNDGSIQSQVRSNGNFSVVSYTGVGSSGNVGHGLIAAPSFYIVKARTTTSSPSWRVYHVSRGPTKQIFLESSNAELTETDAWNDTSPTSSVFSVGNKANESSADYIAYCWAETPGVSSFGEYTGTGNSSQKITTGFKPAFVLRKSASSNVSNWSLMDTARGGLVDNNSLLRADTNAVEEVDALSAITVEDDGFTIAAQNSSFGMNVSGVTYIYAAFAGSDPINIVDVDVAANTMTVDGGVWEGSDGSGSGTWNQSQVWSDNATTSTPAHPPTGAFDGITYGALIENAKISRQLEVDFLLSDNIIGTLQAWSSFQEVLPSASKCYITESINGTETERDVTDVLISKTLINSPSALQGLALGGTVDLLGPLLKLRCTSAASNDGIYISGILIAGKLLVDSSVSGAPVGETVVTGSEMSGTGTFVSTNGIDSMFVDNSNNEWISNDNRLGEEFFIKKLFTALNANDPAHVAMQQAVTAAFAAFPQNAAARRTSIASSLYRLMAGETLSAEESAALTATVRTAVNAVEPFALDGYYPLYYTAAAANAASSINDHHTHDMNGETFYMPDGGTIYHGTYLAPEEEAEVTPTPAPTPTPTPEPDSGY